MAEHRYEREIDDLLKRIEKEEPTPLPFRRRRAAPWAAAAQRARGLLGGQSAVERLMAGAVVLLLATFVLYTFAPRIAGALGLLAFGCFLGALVLSAWNGASGHGPSYPNRAQFPSQPGPAVDWNAAMWRFRRWWRRLRG